ncbi:MAG: hypothetical protein SNJ57_19645 [Cyanobacteriota bacterium]
MQERNKLKSVVIAVITGFLALAAIGLVIGFLGWFGAGTVSFATQSTASVVQAWQGIAGLVETLLASSWSSVVILIGFSVLALIVWWLARVFAQYEEFNPTATLVYQVVAPIGVVSGLLLSTPLLVPYAVAQVFSGNGDALIGQAKQVAGLLAPPEVKSLPTSNDSDYK